MRRFHFSITARSDKMEPLYHFDKEADHLVELLSHAMIAIAQIHVLLMEDLEQRLRNTGVIEDDIPF